MEDVPRNKPQRQIVIEAGRIEIACNPGQRQQTLQLRRKRKARRRPGIVQRLDAEPVTRAEQQVALLVVQYEGEHAVQIRQHILLLLVV